MFTNGPIIVRTRFLYIFLLLVLLQVVLLLLPSFHDIPSGKLPMQENIDYWLVSIGSTNCLPNTTWFASFVYQTLLDLEQTTSVHLHLRPHVCLPQLFLPLLLLLLQVFVLFLFPRFHAFYNMTVRCILYLVFIDKFYIWTLKTKICLRIALLKYRIS